MVTIFYALCAVFVEATKRYRNFFCLLIKNKQSKLLINFFIDVSCHCMYTVI
jgi:hypothetical protein